MSVHTRTCAHKLVCLPQLKVLLCLLSSLSLEDSVKVMGMSPEEDDIPWDNMRDNRDLTVFTSWEPKDRYVKTDTNILSRVYSCTP